MPFVYSSIISKGILTNMFRFENETTFILHQTYRLYIKSMHEHVSKQLNTNNDGLEIVQFMRMGKGAVGENGIVEKGDQ